MNARRPQRKPADKLKRYYLPVMVGLILISLIGIELTLRAAGGILIHSDPLEKADAALVLSGGGIDRLEGAAQLYKDKYVNYVILTDTGEVLDDFGKYSDIVKFEATRLGVPNSAIKLTSRVVVSTWEEASAAKNTLKTLGLNSVIVVTDPSHSYRTRLIFNKMFAGSDIKVSVYPLRDNWYTSKTWWHSLEGWRVTALEYVKLAAYLAGIRRG